MGTLTVVLSLLGCASKGRATRTPEGALSAYVDALEHERFDEAYALLSPEARLGLSREQFEELVRSSPAAARSYSRQLIARDGAPKTVVTTSCGEGVLLVFEDGAWHVAAETVDRYPMRTPAESARSLVFAFAARRFDILHRLMPDERRKGMTPEQLRAALEAPSADPFSAQMESLALGLDAGTFEVMGNRASLSYGKGRTLGLVLERGSWKVESF